MLHWTTFTSFPIALNDARERDFDPPDVTFLIFRNHCQTLIERRVWIQLTTNTQAERRTRRNVANSRRLKDWTSASTVKIGTWTHNTGPAETCRDLNQSHRSSNPTSQRWEGLTVTIAENLIFDARSENPKNRLVRTRAERRISNINHYRRTRNDATALQYQRRTKIDIFRCLLKRGTTGRPSSQPVARTGFAPHQRKTAVTSRASSPLAQWARILAFKKAHGECHARMRELLSYLHIPKLRLCAVSMKPTIMIKILMQIL